MHPLTLVFTNTLFEEEYRAYRLDHDLWYVRIATLMGGLIYGAYSYFDYLLYGDAYITPASIRLGMVMPVSLICFALSFSPDFKSTDTIQFTVIVLLLFAQFGVLLIATLPYIIPAYLSISTMMILIYMTSLGRVLIQYQYGIIFILILSFTFFALFVSNNSFAVNIFEIVSVTTIAIVSLVAGYILEKNDRVDFFQKKIIELQNDHLKISNDKQNDLIEKLKYLNSDLRNFAYMASHDLKTPVRGVATLTQFIEHEMEDCVTPELGEYFNLMHQNIHRMEYLVAGIGKYIDAGIEYKPGWTDPNVLLEKIARSFAVSHHVKIDLPQKVSQILIYDQDLYFVFNEIITNSIKHQLPDQSTQICIVQREGEEGLFLDFIDNGPGIASQYHERVFKIFETLNTDKKKYGAGLGLTIIKKILSKYQASIKIVSQKDSIPGTIVSLFFPSDLLYNRKHFWDGQFHKTSRIAQT